MKNIRFLLAFVLFIPIISCNAQSSKKEVSGTSSDKIEAYYFHFTARCVTCRTIEAKAKEDLETLYPNQMKQGLITFQSVNLEEASSKPLAEKLGVSGQTLLLVKGDQKINITNEGFMYAVVKPEKFKEIINEKVDGLLIK
ncbi:MAG TPA: nitrophenyl compound nitroreductase subunit ArsF family protein [Bacteroidales bacterium]|nr:nitrophenyl compound nitroreductase subunit ArsF family protein [Bacteroidales bacterium]